jgi:hypothetical protein
MALHPDGPWSCQEGTVTTSERLVDLENELRLPTGNYVGQGLGLKWRVRNIYNLLEANIKAKEATQGWDSEGQRDLTLLQRRQMLETYYTRSRRQRSEL